MIEESSDLLIPDHHDEELVANLLSSKETKSVEGDDASRSLVDALLPVLDPPSPQLPCSTRYKTELCVRYASTGCCKYAESCTFAHGLRDLHVPFRHPKYKTELCRSYHEAGYCYYGSRCLFVHGAAEQRPVPRRVRLRRTIPCRTYSNFGFCPYGTRCNFLHAEEVSKPQISVCNTFNSFGFCVFGTRCRFRHVVPIGAQSVKTGPSSAGPVSPTLESPSESPSTSPQAHNAFNFSSQHLGDLLMHLALHLQQAESNKDCDVWEQYQS
ncbi:cysteine three histidine 1 [Festucalex cinctus]